jgi:transposase
MRYAGGSGPRSALAASACPFSTLAERLSAGTALDDSSRVRFEALVHALRVLLRLVAGRSSQPSAVVMGRVAPCQSSVESGSRAGYRLSTRKRRAARCTWAWTPSGPSAGRACHAGQRAGKSAGWRALAAQVAGEITAAHIALASCVDQGYTGEEPAKEAAAHGIRALEGVVRHTEAKRGFILLPKRWGVERSFAWAARFRRLARDYERLPTTLAGLHFVVFACLMLSRILT